MIRLLLLLSLWFGRQDAELYVVNIHGKVLFGKTNKPLVVGDVLHLSDRLVFSSGTDAVTVISPVKGRFVIRDQGQLNGTKLNGVLLAISDHILPASLPQTLAGRGVLNNTTDLKQLLSFVSKEQGDTAAHLLIADTLRFNLAKSGFGQPDKKFFFIRYNLAAQVINKRLSFMENKAGGLDLILDRRLLVVDDRLVDPAMMRNPVLYYRDAVAKTSEKIAAVTLIFGDPGTVTAESKVLAAHLASKEDARTALGADFGYIDLQSFNLFLTRP